MIQEKIERIEIENIEEHSYKIIINYNNNNERNLIIRNTNNNIKFIIPSKLRRIKFIFYMNGVKVEKDSIVLNPEEIIDYFQRYNIKNPCYYIDTN